MGKNPGAIVDGPAGPGLLKCRRTFIPQALIVPFAMRRTRGNGFAKAYSIFMNRSGFFRAFTTPNRRRLFTCHPAARDCGRRTSGQAFAGHVVNHVAPPPKALTIGELVVEDLQGSPCPTPDCATI